MAAITPVVWFPIPAGTNSFTKKDDTAYYSVNGALSVVFYDFTVYKTVNYRNELPVSYTGTVFPASPTTGNTAYSDDRFQDGKGTATPPRPEAFKRTYMLFYNNADPTSGGAAVVAMCKEADFSQFSAAIPTRY